MNCMQIKPSTLPGVKVTHSSVLRSYLRAPRPYWLPIHTFGHHNSFPRLSCSSSEFQTSPFNQRDKFEKAKKFAWEATETSTLGFRKGPSVYDKLRKQMQERELGGGGGAGNRSGHSGGGGGGGSGNPGNDGFEIMNELLQVVLATIGFIFVYFYLIRGQEITRLSRDYIKFLMGAQATPRLKRAMFVWHQFFGKSEKQEPEDWLVHA